MPRGRNLTDSPLLTETRRLLRRYGLHARKRLGQHFLIDPGVLETIVEAAALTSNDTVIEVGPGLGILTRELVRKTQSLRKQEKLMVQDQIDLVIETDSASEKVLKKMQTELLKGTGSKSVRFAAATKIRGELVFENRTVKVGFTKAKR